MQKKSLDEWLNWQSSLSPHEIELGLERITEVWTSLGAPVPATTNILVAGTNGKGSCVAYLQAILLAAGYSVGSYSSPHLFRYNERIQINAAEVTDDQLCAAFEQIEQARQSIPLTYFEFGTLAAFLILSSQNLDVAILEVGLGGRLDAVNIIDADIALVTNIEMDHMDWLGQDRESIGYEKAGVFRPDRPGVFGDHSAPDSLVEQARQLKTDVRYLGRDFRVEQKHDPKDTWDWSGRQGKRRNLPLPSMRGQHQIQNAAACLAVLEALEGTLPVDQQAVREGLLSASVEGRMQIINTDPVWVFDVAHNSAAIQRLVDSLGDLYVAGRCYLVMGLLEDKDVEAILPPLADLVDQYHLVSLTGPRGRSAADLAARAADLISSSQLMTHDSVEQALDYLEPVIQTGDMVILTGSFNIVADGLRWHRDRGQGAV